MDVNAVIDAVIAVLAPIAPHRIPYLPSNAGQLPLICVTLDFSANEQLQYDMTLGQATHYVPLDVFFVTGKNDEESAYRRLNQFLSFPGALSIKELLESDQTLGGLATSVLPGNPTKGGTQGIGQGLYLGIHFPVQVEAYS